MGDAVPPGVRLGIVRSMTPERAAVEVDRRDRGPLLVV
jgi:hypothetical protein